ncbi:amidase signature domain-containing protein [Podospora conica]|nr:amidase signature domain-containing protein [Schizothecium conicum]
MATKWATVAKAAFKFCGLVVTSTPESESDAEPTAGLLAREKSMGLGEDPPLTRIVPSRCSQTTVFQRDEASLKYYVRHRVEATFEFLSAADGILVPAVVLHGDVRTLTRQMVQDTFARFQRTDDVFRKETFARGSLLFIVPPPQDDPRKQARHNSYLGRRDIDGDFDNLKRLQELREYLEPRSITMRFLNELSVPEGPYFVVNHELRQAWRIYSDRLGAFSTTVIPNDRVASGNRDQAPRHFQSLQNSAFTGSEAAVAVPSRLYFKKDQPGKPLNGRRIAIKDNIHLNGVITGMGNRAWAELYGESSETAKFIQDLVDLGAVVVGKTKLSAFAGSEVPPDQCIDYLAPFNPRGDEYQGPSGSSSGAASAAGGYDWLDHSIGTDTTGSIRSPATSHGVWGLRTTWGSLPIQGVVPSCSPLDAFGLLGRTSSSIGDILSAAGNSLDWNNALIQWPIRILYPTEWLPVANEAQQRMTDAFLAALEDFLGIKHEKISLQEEWARTGPEMARHKTLFDIFNATKELNFYDNKHNFDKFRAAYQEKFKKSAYISPAQLARWNRKDDETQQERDQSLKEVELFRAWAGQTLLSSRGDGRYDTIMIVPHGRPGANYRDVPPPTSPCSGPSTKPKILNAVYTVSAMGTPQLLIPIGQNPYQSRVSGREEFAPIFTTLVGGPGTDLMLLDLAQQTLDKAGWPSKVLTGRTMFKVGNNERHSTYV